MNYMESENRKHLIEVGKSVLKLRTEMGDALPAKVAADLKDLDMVITFLQCGLHIPDNLEPALLRLIATAEGEKADLPPVRVFKEYDEEVKENILFVLNGIMSDDTFPEPLRPVMTSIKTTVSKWENGALCLEGKELVVFGHISMAITKWAEKN